MYLPPPSLPTQPGPYQPDLPASLVASADTARIISALTEALQRGLREHALQRAPHLTLLDAEYYIR